MSEKKFDPTTSAARKRMPLFDGCMMYFPDALLAVAAFSLKANDKHNPGEPLYWSKHKSADHANCVGRHLIDMGPDWDAIDPEFGEMHAVALAWRSLAVLQIAIEAKRAGMSVRKYIDRLKTEAEQAEMELKRREPIRKAPHQASSMPESYPLPMTLWYGPEQRTVRADGEKILILNKFGEVVNHYPSPSDLQLAIAGGMYSLAPK